MNQFCIVIPNYNHTHAIAAVLDELKELQLPIIMVDDGSDADAKQVFAELDAQYDFLTLISHAFKIKVRVGQFKLACWLPTSKGLAMPFRLMQTASIR